MFMSKQNKTFGLLKLELQNYFMFILSPESCNLFNQILANCSVPSKALYREIGSVLWKIGLGDFLKMCKKKDAFYV